MNSTKVEIDVIVAARDLISDPEKWTRAAMARNAQGEKVSFKDPTACQWCAFGAIYHCWSKKYPDHSKAELGAAQGAYSDYLDPISEKIFGWGYTLINVNDSALGNGPRLEVIRVLNAGIGSLT